MHVAQERKKAIYDLSGSQNFTKGPVLKFLSVGLRNCFNMSNKLMVLQNTFSLGFDPTITSHLMSQHVSREFILIYSRLRNPPPPLPARSLTI